jgi:hypothetical protein
MIVPGSTTTWVLAQMMKKRNKFNKQCLILALKFV